MLWFKYEQPWNFLTILTKNVSPERQLSKKYDQNPLQATRKISLRRKPSIDKTFIFFRPFGVVKWGTCVTPLFPSSQYLGRIDLGLGINRNGNGLYVIAEWFHFCQRYLMWQLFAGRHFRIWFREVLLYMGASIVNILTYKHLFIYLHSTKTPVKDQES